jgi:hypothetical protein
VGSPRDKGWERHVGSTRCCIGEHVQQHRWRMSTSVDAREQTDVNCCGNPLALKTIDLSIHQRDRCWHPRVRTESQRPPRRKKRPIETTARCAPACIVRLRSSCASASTRCHRTCVPSRGFEPALTGYWRLAFESVLLNHIVHDGLVNEYPEVEVLRRCLFDGHWGISMPTCASSHGDVTSHEKIR